MIDRDQVGRQVTEVVSEGVLGRAKVRLVLQHTLYWISHKILSNTLSCISYMLCLMYALQNAVRYCVVQDVILSNALVAHCSIKSSCWSWSSNTVTAKPSILWKVRKYLLFPGRKWDSPIHVRNMPLLALYQTEGKKYWLPILWRYYNFKATADADVRIKSLKRQLIFSICFITLTSLAARRNF